MFGSRRAFLGRRPRGMPSALQRLCKARMFSDFLSWLNFWGWQSIIVAAAVTLPLGLTSSKEYAELEWPIDIAIAVAWVAFTVNLLGTILKRREKHLYVAIWFYIATAITVAVLHIGNSLAVPAGPFKSYWFRPHPSRPIQRRPMAKIPGAIAGSRQSPCCSPRSRSWPSSSSARWKSFRCISSRTMFPPSRA